jgi:ankyrin repeat protein
MLPPIFELIRFCEQESDFVGEVRQMLNDGLNPNVHCTDGQTPLIRLLYIWGLYCDPGRINHDNFLEAARLFLAAGADAAKRDISGRTALTYAVEYRYTHWETLVRELHEAGAPIGVMEACLMGDALTLEQRLRQGEISDASLQVNCTYFHKYTRYAIQYAAYRGHADCVRLLLEYGANPDHWNNIGVMPSTALGCAVAINRADILAMLLQAGALMKPYHGLSLLIEAIHEGYTDVAHVLLAHGADVNGHGVGSAVRRAAEAGHAEVMRLLLENPQNVSKSRWKLHEALWNAASNGHSEVVRLLLEQNVETHRRIQGKTPLKAAEAGGHTDIVELLSAMA